MYNVHLPIMLESERQAVYRERKRKGLEIMQGDYEVSSTSVRVFSVLLLEFTKYIVLDKINLRLSFYNEFTKVQRHNIFRVFVAWNIPSK